MSSVNLYLLFNEKNGWKHSSAGTTHIFEWIEHKNDTIAFCILVEYHPNRGLLNYSINKHFLAGSAKASWMLYGGSIDVSNLMNHENTKDSIKRIIMYGFESHILPELK